VRKRRVETPATKRKPPIGELVYHERWGKRIEKIPVAIQ